MAVKLTLTDGAGEWLLKLVEGVQSDWHWNASHTQPPSDDDRLYLNEVLRGLRDNTSRSQGERWEGSGSR